MTRSTVAHTVASSSAEAGASLGRDIRRGLSGEAPDAVLVFGSPRHDIAVLLKALHETCSPGVLVGASSAGEFTSQARAEGSVCAVALHAPEMRFRTAVGRGLRRDHAAAALAVVESFEGLRRHDYAHRTALIFTDALAGHMDDLIGRLTVLTGAQYKFAGGGAGDDARFKTTYVFNGTEVLTDAVVALEILSEKPIGIGVRHGWAPASRPLRVTEADGPRVISLNAVPAMDVFAEHAAVTGQRLVSGDPLPFFLHNVLGVATPAGHRLRVPLAAGDDGAIVTAAEVPENSAVAIMGTTARSATEAAAQATLASLEQLHGARPAVALFFDCVATRLRLGRDFDFELEAVGQALEGAAYAGFNSYGQIARVDGQFSGFHNCTAVVCTLPE